MREKFVRSERKIKGLAGDKRGGWGGGGGRIDISVRERERRGKY